MLSLFHSLVSFLAIILHRILHPFNSSQPASSSTSASPPTSSSKQTSTTSQSKNKTTAVSDRHSSRNDTDNASASTGAAASPPLLPPNGPPSMGRAARAKRASHGSSKKQFSNNIFENLASDPKLAAQLARMELEDDDRDDGHGEATTQQDVIPERGSAPSVQPLETADPAEQAERKKHSFFMNEALDMVRSPLFTPGSIWPSVYFPTSLLPKLSIWFRAV